METEISDNILGVLWSKLTYTCLGYYGSLADASLARAAPIQLAGVVLTDFFAEVVAVGEALACAGSTWRNTIPRIFIRATSEKRLAAVNEFAKTWKRTTAKARSGRFKKASNRS